MQQQKYPNPPQSSHEKMSFPIRGHVLLEKVRITFYEPQDTFVMKLSFLSDMIFNLKNERQPNLLHQPCSTAC